MWTAFAIAMLVIGLALLKRGLWPRRTGDTPHCRGCGYNLTGLTAERCPECGRELDGHGRVFGERHRSVLAGIAGAFLLCIPIVSAVVALAHIDIYPYCPTTLLIFGLDDPVRGARIWDEVERRMKAKSLSRSQLHQVATRCLKATAGTNQAAPRQSMLDWLGQAYMAGQLSPTQATQFESQVLRVELFVRQKVVKGQPAPYVIRYTSYCPPPMSIGIETGQVLVNGKPQSAGRIQSSLSTPTSWLSGAFAGLDKAGSYHVNLQVVLRLHDANGTVYVKRGETLASDFQVLDGELKEHIKSIRAPELCERLSHQMSVNYVRLDNNTGGVSTQGAAEVSAAHPIPIELAFQILARIDGKEYPMGSVHFHKTNVPGISTCCIGQPYSGPQVPRMDVILRGSAEAAASDMTQEEFWDGELVYKDVPVTCR